MEGVLTEVCGVSNGGKPAAVVHGSDSTQVLRQSLEISCVILLNLGLLTFHAQGKKVYK